MLTRSWNTGPAYFRPDSPSGGSGGEPDPKDLDAITAKIFGSSLFAYMRDKQDSDAIQDLTSAAATTLHRMEQVGDIHDLHPDLQPYATLLHTIDENFRLDPYFITQTYISRQVIVAIDEPPFGEHLGR